MTSIAWAIVFMITVISDIFYVYKFGTDNKASVGQSMIAFGSIGIMIALTIKDLAK